MVKSKVCLVKIVVAIFILSPFLLVSEGFWKTSIAGTPHVVYGNMVNSDGSIPPDGDLEFEAYIVGRDLETLIESTTGCGYKNGWWWVETGNFPTDWTGDETLRVVFTTISSGEDNSVDITLNGKGNQQLASLALDTGWNLISLSLQPEDTDITKVLDTISGKYVSAWEYVGGESPWIFYDPTNQTGSLSSMEAGVGYWLNIGEASILSISGSRPSNEISLTGGWNLVGYNSFASRPISDALSSIGGKFLLVWAFMDGEWRLYDPILTGFSDLTSMQPGYGYWIYATEGCTWNITGSP